MKKQQLYENNCLYSLLISFFTANTVFKVKKKLAIFDGKTLINPVWIFQRKGILGTYEVCHCWVSDQSCIDLHIYRLMNRKGEFVL